MLGRTLPVTFALAAGLLMATPVRAEEQIVGCGSSSCGPLKTVEKFTLNASYVPAECDAFKDAVRIDFKPANGDDPAVTVGHCRRESEKISAAAKEASYSCDVEEPEGVTSGKLTTALCNKGPTASIALGSPDAERKGAREVEAGSDGKAKDGDGLAFLPMQSWHDALTALGLPLEGHRLGNYYDRRHDVVVLFFDGDATPFFPVPDIIDEDDDIYVAIVDYEDRLEGRNTKIAIQGCNRPPVEPRIFGKGIKDTIASAKATEKKERKPKIILRAFGKCAGAASGGPIVSVERNDKQNLVTIPVNPLYRLAVGLGFGYDATRTSKFAVRAPAGSSLTRVAESKDRMGIAPIVYVSFYPTARDFRKTDLKSAGQRLQLFVGMGTDDLPNNMTIGAGFELTMGLNLLLGWHALTREKVLAEGSGLQNGSSFDGTTDTLPVRERWATGSVFAGVGLSSELLEKLR